MNKMIANATNALTHLFELKADETLLVITDQATNEIAGAWARAAEKMGANVIQYKLDDAMRPLDICPQALLDMMPGADIAITAFTSLVDEAPFRLSLLSELSRHVRRLGHSPGITRYMMSRGGMTADYSAMESTAHDLISRLEGAVSIKVTAPAGTEITLNIEGRGFETDASIEDGSYGNLPCGEVWCAPVESDANGIVVCDGSVGDLGHVPCPVRLVVNNGRVTSVLCDDATFKAEILSLLEYDAGASIIGEFGIGINPAASLIGNLLEDEKAAGTAHIAFGNNRGMKGGRNSSGTHQDFLFLDPTVTAVWPDGREVPLLVSGRITRARRHHELTDSFPWNNVLVVVDLSTTSERAIILADLLCRRNGAHLTVCHIINIPIPVNMLYPQYSAMNNGMENLKQEHVDAVRHLNAMVNDLTGRRPGEYEVAVFIGDPIRSVLEYAGNHDIDLIVAPAGPDRHGGRRFTGAGFRSLADHASCDVLIAR